MDSGKIRKAWLAAAVTTGGIVSAMVLYAVLVEALLKLGHRPPLAPPAAYAAKYALYLVAAAAVFLVRPLAARLEPKSPAPEAAVKALTLQAIVRAALCEVPAIAGLILFLLAGYRADFYLLLVFAVGLEIYHFPRLGAWEERLRGEFGQL